MKEKKTPLDQWREAHAAVRELNKTLDKLQSVLATTPKPKPTDFSDILESLFGKSKP